MNFHIPQPVSQITNALNQKGFLTYLVGGCVRDLLLKREPKDWDIATNATPEEIIPLFPKTVYENNFGTVTVVNEELQDLSLRHVEVTPFRLESKYTDKRHPDQVTWSNKLEDDLKRRDFTINALAFDPSSKKIIDLNDGLSDLKDKVIRTVGSAEERFEEDPLRMLRAIRFAAQLGFTINSETSDAIQKQAQLLKSISKERIRDEFTLIIMSPNPMVSLIFANKLGLLSHILPEIERGIDVKQNGEHIYDVWGHSLRALQHAADKNYSLGVRLAALLHDVGKPPTQHWNKEKNDYTFYGHEVKGSKMAEEALKRLKFSRETVSQVTRLVRNHMFFSDIDQITLSAVRRIIAKVGQADVWKLMELRTCDRIGMGRPKEQPYRLRKYQSMIEEALRSPTSVTMLKITGNDVIRVTNLEAGPKIGQILHALLSETLENPTLNDENKLINRAKELAKLSNNELAELGKKGRENKASEEEKELKKIRSRYKVN